nr:hypothetical protein [uncultured Cupriavidus sp.]
MIGVNGRSLTCCLGCTRRLWLRWVQRIDPAVGAMMAVQGNERLWIVVCAQWNARSVNCMVVLPVDDAGSASSWFRL